MTETLKDENEGTGGPSVLSAGLGNGLTKGDNGGRTSGRTQDVPQR